MSKISVTEITKSLKGFDFPAEKEDLVEYARDNGAPEEVIRQLQEMPDEEFGSMSDVMSAFGETRHEETVNRN